MTTKKTSEEQPKRQPVHHEVVVSESLTMAEGKPPRTKSASEEASEKTDNG